jgi:lysyl-tRNA synthetase class 2
MKNNNPNNSGNNEAEVKDAIDYEQAASEEHQVRLKKVEDLRAIGVEPWPQYKPVNASCKDVVDEYTQDAPSREYQVSGRIMSSRLHGKTAFVDIQDRSGRLQVYVRSDAIGHDAFEQFKQFVDMGDIVWFKGTSFVTKMGETTLKATEFALLSKCLHPLPDKFHGLSDIEVKYRQRYLDLITNQESMHRFITRSHIVSIMRRFFDDHNYVEVETPMLHPIPGGAVARPFITHHNALDMDLYLRIAPELYLKRLMVGGLERVYEINRNFRNEGISTRHNPEFTMLEFYTANEDYIFAMDLVEDLLRRIAKQVCDSLQIQYGDYTLDFEKPFARISMRDAVAQYAQCSDADLNEDTIDALCAKHKITFEDKNATWGIKLYALFEALVEPHLAQPTFITEFPVEVSPLAKRNADNPLITDRFELFIAGMELGNAFTELNDPFDQADRFREQAKALSGGDVEAHHYDADYIQALEYGLPPTVGVGIGIDRLTMLLTNTTSIKDVILFPTLKRK